MGFVLVFFSVPPKIRISREQGVGRGLPKRGGE